jgi:tRNA pseudouridine55 synthase
MAIERVLDKDSLHTSLPFLDGCLIIVNKPIHWTSFDVVNKIRFAIKHKYGVKKCKVGHAGTLDPLATGLLLVCTGPYTKMIDVLQNESKVYSGVIQLGSVTPTYDSESTPENHKIIPLIDDSLVQAIINEFSGAQWQIPPAFSAIKVNGKKSYDLARRGNDVILAPRPIEIYSLQLEVTGNDKLQFVVHCSKGTYIRSLANDIGHFLGCGGYLSSLHRESISTFRADQSLTVEEIILNIKENALVN